MSYTPDFIKKIVDDYVAHEPTVETSQAIVKQLSAVHRLAVPKLRAILVKQQVYVAQPKPKSTVESGDAEVLLDKFSSFAAPDNGSYSFEMARYRFVEELRPLFGYTGSALENFAKENLVWPLSAKEQKREADRIERDAAWQAEEDEQERIRIVELQRMSGLRSGPDGCGWIFIIGLSLLIFMWLSSAQNSSSTLERTAADLCVVMGGCK